MAAVLLIAAGTNASEQDDLFDALDGKDTYRIEAVTRLLEIGPKVFPRALKEYSAKRSDKVRSDLAHLVVRLAASMESVEGHGGSLARYMRDKDGRIRRRVGPTLLKAGPRDIRALERLLASKHADAREAAARGLGAIGEPAFDKLRELLAKDNRKRRLSALLAIAQAGSAAREFVPAVVALLSHEEARLRRRAAYALGAVGAGSDDAIRGLLAALDDSDATVAYAAARGLGGAAASRVAQLAAELEKAGPRRRDRLHDALRALPAAAAAEWESTLLAAKDPAPFLAALPSACVAHLSATTQAKVAACASNAAVALRRAALAALAHARWPDPAVARGALAKAAKHSDSGCRAAACRGLGQHGVGDAQPLLVAALDDTDAHVRMEAAFALWRHRHPRADPLPACLALVRKDPASIDRIAALAQFAWPATEELARAARSKDPRISSAAVRALGSVLHSGRCEDASGRAARLDTLHDHARVTAVSALRWLAAAQEPDGRWDSGRWKAHTGSDVGLTALALLAFLAAGTTDAAGEYAANVRRGLSWLVARQEKDGHVGARVLSSASVQHAMAASALCEAAAVSPDPAYRGAAQRALDYIGRVRSPDQAWKYKPRSGKSDTYVTAWMVTALRLGTRAGLQADPASLVFGLEWIDKMTDPNFGQAGYDYPGSYPARPRKRGGVGTAAAKLGFGHPIPPRAPSPPLDSPRRREEYRREKAEYERWLRKSGLQDVLRGAYRTQSITAASAWARVLCGGRRKLTSTSRELIDETPPLWNPEEWTIDFCYWHWGALLMAQFEPGEWRGKLIGALSQFQNADGSWDPIGIWGPTGGRVFTTATAAHALLAPCAYPPGWLNEDAYRERYADGFKAFEKALRSDDLAIREAAARYAPR